MVEKGGIKVKVLCTDPKEGIHEITDTRTEHHTSFWDGEKMGDRIGKVKSLSFNEKKKWIAIYSDSESHGNVIVLMDMQEVARQQTNQLGATGITICGNEAIFIVLNMPESICIVGP